MFASWSAICSVPVVGVSVVDDNMFAAVEWVADDRRLILSDTLFCYDAGD